MVRIGIVGCGAIGSSLAEIIRKELRGKAEVAAVFDVDTPKALKLAAALGKSKNAVAADLSRLISRSDLVIEAASAAAAWTICKQVLSRGRDAMIMSVGGIVAHARELSALAARKKARVYVPSGAISGIDGLKASARAGLRRVTLTTRKPPQGFKSVAYVQAKKIDLEHITKDTVLFSGTARQAMSYFPQNINVAGVLSLAGLGDARTRVRIIASPGLTRNIHEIEIVSAAGTVFTRTENVVHPHNPKTSFLAVLAAAAMLRQIVSPVRIGT
ncbi:MAG TPA: DUF108 domain-containing protein [Candidatus Omnitrophota bacterium]|nr:DUF108 domain-containing protein [Candidatus Omnitrophota bacterium]HRZ15382.1 DUF108 domain-containing protein [Candidatus Omnitrophota bacterium]